MLYTGKGDSGNTSFFNCDQRFSKSSEMAEALGSVDEINSLLGLCKVRTQIYADQTQINADTASARISAKISGIRESLVEIVGQVQQDLFIIQASLAGADKKITKEKILYLEKIIAEIEKELPEIKSFFVSGGTELAALLDYSRTVARRAERRVVELSEKEKNKVAPEILAYLNRISSLLYALARFVNYKEGIKEQSPSYD